MTESNIPSLSYEKKLRDLLALIHRWECNCDCSCDTCVDLCDAVEDIETELED